MTSGAVLTFDHLRWTQSIFAPADARHIRVDPYASSG
jgi:hypothetical protein